MEKPCWGMSPPPESVDDTARGKKINLGFVRVGGGCVKIPERRGGHIPGVTRHAVQIQPCLGGSPGGVPVMHRTIPFRRYHPTLCPLFWNTLPSNHNSHLRQMKTRSLVGWLLPFYQWARMQRFLCVWENIGIRRHIFFGNLHVRYCTYSVGEPPANNNLSPKFKSKFSFIKSLFAGPSLSL